MSEKELLKYAKEQLEFAQTQLEYRRNEVVETIKRVNFWTEILAKLKVGERDA